MTASAPGVTGSLMRIPGFRRLLGVRLFGQFSDGVFQASLAGTVLFNPERQTHPADIAVGFAVLLLPYSVLGPFCGVLLDRWSRQRVLLLANLARALLVCLVALEIGLDANAELFYASALVVISFNRFILSALSACLPHVVAAERLITANAISTTFGGVATSLGGGAAIALRASVVHGNAGYSAIALGSAVAYLVAALVARGFSRTALGPDETARCERETAGAIVRGLLDGGRHIRSHPAVVRALAVIGIHRLLYGVITITTLLLYRSYFHDDGFLRAGLTGLGQLVAGIAVGGFLAAIVSPYAVKRLGFVRWPAIMLVAAGVMELAGGLPFRLSTFLPAAALLGFVSQGVKICIDTVVAQRISDDYRGRVFTLYDMLFNVVFVAAGVITALVLPENGHSPVAVAVLGIAYVVVGGGYFLLGRSSDDPPPPVVGALHVPHHGNVNAPQPRVERAQISRRLGRRTTV